MQRPSRPIAIVARDSQGCMFAGKMAKHIALALEQVIQGSNAEATQYRLSDLPFDPPHILANSVPEQEKPSLVTLLLNLSYLIVDAEHDSIAPEGQRLNLTALTMLGVLAGN